MRTASSFALCLTVLCVLALHAQTTSFGTEAKTILVWRVGSPHNDQTPDTAVPPGLKRTAQKLGFGLKIEAYPAQGFAELFFKAVEAHQEPDVLVNDNDGIIHGISTKLGSFTGIASDRTVRDHLIHVEHSLSDLSSGRGWQYLISSSQNFSAAKMLALTWRGCETGSATSNAPPEVLATASELATRYIENPESLAQQEDDSFLSTELKLSSAAHVRGTEVCGFAGNDHLAFVSEMATFEAADALGQKTLLVVLTRQDASWRLLRVSVDPVSNSGLPRNFPAISRLFQASWSQSKQPVPARIVSPEEGRSPVPAAGQRFGNYTWTPSSSENVAFEIVEFAYDGDARLFFRLPDKQATSESISDGQLWTTGNRWKWRVWSVSDAGRIAFSSQRSFIH
jgi:hypothetical protein